MDRRHVALEILSSIGVRSATQNRTAARHVRVVNTAAAMSSACSVLLLLLESLPELHCVILPAADQIPVLCLADRLLPIQLARIALFSFC